MINKTSSSKGLPGRRFFVCSLLVIALAGCAVNPGATAIHRGMRALEKGRYAESIEWLQKSLAHLATDNERAIVFNSMGICFHKLGQEQDAIQAFEKASASNPGAVEPVFNLGVVLFETRNDDKAIACFEKAVLLNGQDNRAFEFLAAVYGRRSQWDNARRVLQEACRQTPNSPRLLTALALIELRANNINKAAELLQQALEQDARYAPAIFNLAVINRQWLQNGAQALPLFVEYARMAPSGPQQEQARSMIKEIKHDIARQNVPNVSQVPVQDAPTPAPANSAAALLPPPEPAVVFPSFEELMQVARKLEDQGRREAAFNNYLRIARAAEQADKPAIRNQCIKRAVPLADGNPQACYDLGVFYMERNRKDEAVIYFKAAAEHEPGQRPACLALAKIALEEGEYDTAIVSLKKADQIQPADPEALWLLANVYDRRLFLTNTAAEAYGRFIKRFPDNPCASNAMARIMELTGSRPPEDIPADKKQAQSFLQRMFKSSSKKPE